MDIEEYENLKIGDKIYKITSVGVIELQIKDRCGYKDNDYLLDNGSIFKRFCKKSKTYFKTREDAENKYNNDIKMKEKKIKLFEYEKKLNKELGIETFIIQL